MSERLFYEVVKLQTTVAVLGQKLDAIWEQNSKILQILLEQQNPLPPGLDPSQIEPWPEVDEPTLTNEFN